ncbi:surface-anchored protein [Actinoalloteichus hoggarensis]|uniref:Uncharacterized protein n=1 Tax=Actinoalloteichus hoggarensis TaxID=1470176 RepID=A0A221W6Y7_9PSEU|nr:choice-of-anchor M domain-containing protein [Actinoalloteichus hoggarensis]ASO21514.1 hypothetical protein AHOG_19460 [Actinoalloteichus hoggarensis]MBB5922103.1 surface-anchored protein [Actinoalloteichus hoggarensis]
MRRHKRYWAGLLVSAIGLPLAGGLLLTGSAAAQERVVLSEGHVDAFEVQYVDDALRLLVHDGTNAGSPAVDREPADVLFAVTDASAATAPANLAVELPGFAEAGQDVWVLPQNPVAGQLYQGWATERLPAGLLAEGSRVSFEIRSVEGPGEFALWQSGFGGLVVKANSGDGLPDTFQAAAAYTHEHANWGFSEPGDYTIEVNAHAVLADGTEVESGIEAYGFSVGGEAPETPEDPDVPGPALVIDGMAHHYHTGDVATLTATYSQETDLTDYRWFTRAAPDQEWSLIPGATGPVYSFTAGPDVHGDDIIVRLYDGDAIVAESAPATVVVDDH